MDSIQHCVFCHRFRILAIYMLILISTVASTTHERLMTEGKAAHIPAESAKKGMNEKKEVEVVKTRIGSRPPKCEIRCSSCGHCEPVQVPVTPIIQGHITKRHNSSAAAAFIIAYPRGDGISNYKPMTWKCKCGDMIFNP